MKSYDEVVSYLFRLRRFGMKPGLEAVSSILDVLGNPQDTYRIIHVGGTKGKGSVCNLIASILLQAGYKVGLYTSPHLVSYTERIKVNGEEISRNDVVRMASRIRNATKETNLSRRPYLTFFETTTAIAFEYFRERKVDFAVIEVGMGGRLDATNVCKPLVTVITNIDYEHTEVLGDTLSKIAMEKAGIIKTRCITITAETKKEPLEVIENACTDRGAKLFKVGEDISYGVVTNTLEAIHITENEVGFLPDKIRNRFSVYGLFDDVYDSITIKLGGQHQTVNAATAIAAVEALRLKNIIVKKNAIIKGLAVTEIPGRFQVVKRKPCVILDIAHTPASAIALRNAIDQIIRDKVTFIIGISSDKDIDGIVKALVPVMKKVIVSKATSDRASDTKNIAQSIRKNAPDIKTTEIPNISGAVKQALAQASSQDVIIITGSGYVCGEALAFFNNKKIDGLSENIKILSRDPKYVDIVFNELRKLFGSKTGPGSELASQAVNDDPFRVLIATILSHRTRDENTHKATEMLFSVYKTPKDIALAPVKKIESLVHSTGFYRVKAKNIKNVSRIIWKEYQGRVPDNMEDLLALPAVGRKTANCVLVYAFSQPAIPVDTHVHRISNRLGLVATITPEDTEVALSALVPKKYWLELNDYFVQFGKTICMPIRPGCRKCPLNNICPSSTNH